MDTVAKYRDLHVLPEAFCTSARLRSAMLFNSRDYIEIVHCTICINSLLCTT